MIIAGKTICTDLFVLYKNGKIKINRLGMRSTVFGYKNKLYTWSTVGERERV